MPTYDNFKQDFSKNNRRGAYSTSKRKPQSESMDFGNDLGKLDRINAVANQHENQYWEKYFFDLNSKVKAQRDAIKKADEK